MSSPGKKLKNAGKVGPERKRSGGHGRERRERADEALRQQLWLAETLLDSIPLPVFYKDARGRYLGCNRAFAELVGKPGDQITGRTVYEVAPPELAEIYHRADDELLRHPGRQTYEAPVVSAGGTRRDVVFNIATFMNPDGAVAGIVGTINDITERKAIWQELERRVKERASELEDANRSLRDEAEEHRRDEEALKRRVEFERLITSLSSKFISLGPDEIDGAIRHALKSIGEFAGVDRCYIGKVYDGTTLLDITYEWAAGGIRQYPEFFHHIVVDEAYPWSANIVRKLEVLHIPSVEDLPPEAARDREAMEAQQIKSMVVVPMVYKKAFAGILGFDSVRVKKTWNDDDIALLRIVGEIFTSAIERKRIGEALRESEEKFRALAESSNAPITVFRDGEYIYANRAAAEVTGHTIEELLKTGPLETIHPDDRDKARKSITMLERGEKARERLEIRVLRKDGSTRWIDVSAVPISYHGKNALISIALDITERKQAEEELRNSEERFKTLFENASVAIFIADAVSGVIMDCNPKAEELIGRPRNEIIGMHQSGLHPAGEKEKYREMFRRHARLPRVQDQEGVIQHKDGGAIPVIISATRLTVDGKSVIIGYFLDITGRKQAEQELKDAKARAELYIDLMGHDISNMNQAMMGYLEMAQEMIDLKGHEELIQRPLEIIRHSTRLIDSVKKLEQAQAGRYPLKRVDLCSVLSEVVAGYSGVPGRDVRINYMPRKGCMVMASDLLGHVFDNLVDNAIRHSEGPLAVDVSLDRATERGRDYYRVSVADNGPGIPDGMKKKIFTFVQSATGKASRRGLGLYMARTLVADYGGWIWVEDRVAGDHAKGAKFVVMLPVA